MILLVHLLFGALIGQKISISIIAIILAFLSHYLLDIFPHIEYPIKNIDKNQWRKATPDFLRVILDFCCGILLIYILSNNQPIIYICAFFAILPDGLTVLNYFITNKILESHSEFHREKIHALKNKKISNFWRIFSQTVIVIASILFLKF